MGARARSCSTPIMPRRCRIESRDAATAGCNAWCIDRKVAIVTGGGIGSAVERRLVLEGAKVAIADLFLESAERAADPLGDDALPVRFDAADPESVRAMVEATVAQFGRLDILHNNAAMTDPAKAPQDTTAVGIPFEIWREILDINLTGYMIGCKYAIPHMIAGGGGSIVNTASNSGTAGDLARIAYGSSKGVIITLTRYVATQHGKQNIRCNSIAPGVLLTEALEKTVPGFKEIIKRHSDARVRHPRRHRSPRGVPRIG